MDVLVERGVRVRLVSVRVHARAAVARPDRRRDGGERARSRSVAGAACTAALASRRRRRDGAGARVAAALIERPASSGNVRVAGWACRCRSFHGCGAVERRPLLLPLGRSAALGCCWSVLCSAVLCCARRRCCCRGARSGEDSQSHVSGR